MDDQARLIPEIQPEHVPLTTESRPVSKEKILTGALLALALAVGLYFINRFWIVPAARAQAHASGQMAWHIAI